jgi:hypothetical protein
MRSCGRSCLHWRPPLPASERQWAGRGSAEGLVGLRQRAALGDVPDAEELRRFRGRVAELLKSGRDPAQFSQYRDHVLQYAE